MNRACLFALGWFVAAAAHGAQPDLLIADFEGTHYGAWTVAGNALGSAPARGTLPNQMQVEGFLGRGLVNTFFKGDGTTGTLTSPSFLVERRYLKFLIGGGGHAGLTCLNLRVDDRVVRTATGPNTQPGGSERLDWQQWDVGEFGGRSAVLEVVDQATGGWGHINVDHIVQTDLPRPRMLTNVSRALRVERAYLNLPVKNGAPKRWFSVKLEGETVRDFEIELAEDEPDWWAFLDLKPFRGQEVILQVDRLREGSKALERLASEAELKGAEDLYAESRRPQFHFSARRGWLNDPNGLVFYEGEYHLFFQHNPYGWNWGNMHWGHAVSHDLVRWRERPEALYPDEQGTMFSGSAVVDWPDTAGFAQGDERALVCIYTAAGGTSRMSKSAKFTQGIAYSTDRGRSWSKYAKNPVLPHLLAENRDPKVFWYAPEKKWVMALYLEGSNFALFESRDLKQWQRLSSVSVPGSSECPEMFEIAVDGQTRSTRWIFYGGNGRYLVGRFDGRTFTPESGPHPLHFGNCFYASQTYNDIPAADGRRILIGWGQVNLPGMPFNQMMTFPVELTLRTTADGLRLFANPVREIETLRVKKHAWQDLALKPEDNPLSALRGDLFDLTVELMPGSATEVRVGVRGEPVVYDVVKQELACVGRKAPLKLVAGKVRLRLLVDRASIEIFGNDGHLYMPMGFQPAGDNHTLALQVRGGEARVTTLTVHELESAWEER